MNYRKFLCYLGAITLNATAASAITLNGATLDADITGGGSVNSFSNDPFVVGAGIDTVLSRSNGSGVYASYNIDFDGDLLT